MAIRRRQERWVVLVIADFDKQRSFQYVKRKASRSQVRKECQLKSLV
jgi:hypothetical protein